MAASTVFRAGFDDSVLVRSVDLMTTDQIGMIVGEESTDFFSDRRILVGWQTDGTFQTESCNKMRYSF